MSQSSLVNVKIMTKHYGYPDGKAGRGGAKIDKIFVHHMAGILTAEQCGNVFKSREASAHYGIDSKGRVGQYVLEENTAWHCANRSYNQRSIGIELSNDGGAKTNWHVSDKAIAKCIDLIVDICKRNGIKKINYTGNLSGNLCMHQWTASTACPGPYLKTKFKYIANQVNAKLSAQPVPTPTKKLYRVRKTWQDAKSQVGAYSVLANAKKEADKTGLNVFDDKGTLVYAGKKKEPTKGEKIAAKAQVLAYTSKTSAGAYPKGKPTPAYKTALAKAYPDRSKWGAAPKVGASCDVFVGTCVRSSGIDKNFPRGLDDQIPYLSKSKVFSEIRANVSTVRDGDIIVYRKLTGGGHICIVAGGKIKEAAIKAWYGITTDSLKTRLSKTGKKWVKVYRAK